MEDIKDMMELLKDKDQKEAFKKAVSISMKVYKILAKGGEVYELVDEEYKPIRLP